MWAVTFEVGLRNHLFALQVITGEMLIDLKMELAIAKNIRKGLAARLAAVSSLLPLNIRTTQVEIHKVDREV